MKSFYNILKLIRFQNLFLGFLVVLLSAYLLKISNVNLIIMNIILIISTMSFGYIDNDIKDLVADKINHPKRVLAKEHVSIKSAKQLRIFFFVIIILISFFFNYKANVFLYLLILPTLTMYNLFFKKTPLFGNVLVAFLLACVFLFVEVSYSDSMGYLWLPAILTFNLSLIREVLKDLHDYSGDCKQSMCTLPIAIGIKKTCNLLCFYIFLCLMGFSFPYFFGYYGYKYLISLIFLIEFPLIYSLLLLIKSQTITTFRNMIFLYKILTINGIFVIFSTTI